MAKKKTEDVTDKFQVPDYPPEMEALDSFDEVTPAVPSEQPSDAKDPRCTLTFECKGRNKITEKDGFRVVACTVCKKVDCKQV